MTLLDRFRTTTPHKHPDPAVRLAYIEEVPLDERAIIAEVARDDEDPRVRRAAVSKLMDPAALVAIARAEGDEGVRAQASAMLRDIALEAFEGVEEADSLAAVEGLTDAKALVQVAKGALRESTALAALARIDDARALGSVARHAALDASRRAALDRLADHDEVLAVAMNSDFRDSALAALERLSDRADLDLVAARATNKSAAKRARSALRELDEREAAERADAAARAAEARQLAEVEAARARAAEAEARAAEAAARARDAEAASHPAPIIAAEPSPAAIARDEEAHAARLAAEAEARVREQDAARARAAEEAVRAQEQAAADARARRDALARLRNLAARVEALAARPDLTLKAAERALRDLRAALADLPPLPSRDDHDEIARRLEATDAALSPRALELREAADWQRFVNAGVQEQLCARMEALESEGDPEALLSTIRDLQQQWRAAADVPRAQADALWRRFKAAHDRLWPRCEAFLAGQAAVRAEHLQKKIALCERVEALAESTSWLQTADEIKHLQAEWKAIGPASRGQEKAVWDRFRSACDWFFTRRNEDLKQRKAVWAENLARKDALCAKAEALAVSDDRDAAVAAVRALQAEWKTIGPVKKSRSEAIWLRFRAACDAIFAHDHQRRDAAAAERLSAREAICQQLEGLIAGDATEPPADLQPTLRALETRWHNEPPLHGPDRERATALDRRFAGAWTAVADRWRAAISGTDLDPDARRRRLEDLCRRVESLAASPGGAGPADDPALSPAERLALRLKETLASNTIGGKVDEGSRWRAAAEDVRQAQASWARIGLVPDEIRRPLADRFDRACRYVLQKAGGIPRPGGPSSRPGPSRRPAPGRPAGPGRPGGADRSGGSGA